MFVTHVCHICLSHQFITFSYVPQQKTEFNQKLRQTEHTVSTLPSELQKLTDYSRYYIIIYPIITEGQVTFLLLILT